MNLFNVRDMVKLKIGLESYHDCLREGLVGQIIDVSPLGASFMIVHFKELELSVSIMLSNLDLLDKNSPETKRIVGNPYHLLEYKNAANVILKKNKRNGFKSLTYDTTSKDGFLMSKTVISQKDANRRLSYIRSYGIAIISEKEK